jgi:hypothetical protein
LNAAEWLRLGFFMDFVPPVMPGPKSTYTPVRKTDATSLLDHRCSANDRVTRGENHQIRHHRRQQPSFP